MKKRYVIGLSFLGLLFLGWFAGGRALKSRGYAGTGDFLLQVLGNYPKSINAMPLKLSIQVEPNDYVTLERVVSEARERGVIMPEGNEYVPARLSAEGGEFKGKLRIKGKLTDHVKGNKWSFRIIGRKGGAFNGMQRFSLQHPGTRNYLYEWLYHRLMDREGVITLRYGFVDVDLNRESLGIYAYEEHFGQELLMNNQRVPGPIFRFDPGLYWIKRLNEMKGLRFREAYADHHAALIDAYDSSDIFKSKKRTEAFRQALLRMNALRAGKVTASDIFDTDKIALRHAIIDLIGGHHSMDWSDVKFYYDPVAQLIEPVAYESFSVRPLKQLAGSFRYQGRAKSRLELHDILFNDEQLFRQYIKHLERVSSVTYLDEIFTDLQVEMDSVSAILFKEFPYKPLNKDLYYKNAEIIRTMLDFPKGVHAFVSSDGKGMTNLQLTPISDLPVEVHHIFIQGVEVPLNESVIVPARKQGNLGDPTVVQVNIADTLLNKYKDIQIEWSVLGASVKKKTGVIPLDYPTEEELGGFLSIPKKNEWKQFSMLEVDTTSMEVFLKAGEHELNKDLFIPAEFKFIAHEKTTLHIADGVSVVVEGTVDWVHVSTNTGLNVNMEGDGQIVLRNSNRGNKLRGVRFSRKTDSRVFRPMLVIVNSSLKLEGVKLTGMGESGLMQVTNSDIHAEGCTLSKGKYLLTAYFSHITGQWQFLSSTNDALFMYGGDFIGQEGAVLFAGNRGRSMKLDGRATCSMNQGAISDGSLAVRVRNGSSLHLQDVVISHCDVGVFYRQS